jgi:hypothetical protein
MVLLLQRTVIGGQIVLKTVRIFGHGAQKCGPYLVPSEEMARDMQLTLEDRANLESRSVVAINLPEEHFLRRFFPD